MPAPSLAASDLSPHFLLDADYYTNPVWVAQETERIFKKNWLYVGDSDRLQPGQVWALTIAGQPIVITCLAPGEFKAFYNVCPHRAALLCAPEGIHASKHLVCPYHAWVYDLTGHLIGVPSEHFFPTEFDRQAYPLKPIRVECWSGFLFVSFSDTASPLETYLGSITTYLGQHRRAETQHLFSQSTTVACNWKNYHDNTLCDYHVAIAHRTTLHRIQGPIKHYGHQLEDYVNVLYTPPTKQWVAENHILPDIPTFAQENFLTYGIFPNLHLLGFPDGTLAWIHIEPLTVEACEVRLEVYGIPGICLSPEILKAEFDAFMTEDVSLTESAQQGYASGQYVPGPVNALEARIVHQQQLILDYLKFV